jgi:hypothetical protein
MEESEGEEQPVTMAAMLAARTARRRRLSEVMVE